MHLPPPPPLLPLILAIALLSVPAFCQFGSFFDQMFGSQGGGGGSGGGAGGGNRAGENNVASDSSWYRQTYSSATCNKYLCPGTLACVDKPTHCPCDWEDTMVKVELHGDWGAVCVSKGGKPGFAERKVELARKGLL